MGFFSDRLSFFLKEKGVANNEVIRYTGLDRSTFFKIKNGTRKPRDLETVSRLSSALRLNQREMQQMTDAFFMDHLGMYLYRGFLALDDLLASLHGKLPETTRVAPAEVAMNGKELRTFYGNNAVLQVIGSLLTGRTGNPKEDVVICETRSNEAVFRMIHSALNTQPERVIRHIVKLDNTNYIDVNDQLYNVLYMKEALPLIFEYGNYEARYYYGSVGSVEDSRIHMTNIMKTGDYVFIYNEGLTAGILFHSEDMRVMFEKMIRVISDSSHHVACPVSFEDAFSEYGSFFQNALPEDPSYVLSPGICLTLTLREDETLTTEHIREDCPWKADFGAFFHRHAGMMKETYREGDTRSRHLCIRSGVRYTAEKGLVNEFPEEYSIPLSCGERRDLLRMWKLTMNHYDFHITEIPSFSENSSLSVIATPSGTFLSMYVHSKETMVQVSLREPTVVHLFYRYLEYLYEEQSLSGSDRDDFVEQLIRLTENGEAQTLSPESE